MPIPYPSAIFIREKALVVNLETIRMIIGEADSATDPVSWLNSRQDFQQPMVRATNFVDRSQSGCKVLPVSLALPKLEAALRSLRLASGQFLLHRLCSALKRSR